MQKYSWRKYHIFKIKIGCVLSCSNHVQLFVTLWTVALQAHLSEEVSRQEHWSGLPCPPPGDRPNPGIESGLLHWQAGSLPLVPVGKFLKQGWSLLLNHTTHEPFCSPAFALQRAVEIITWWIRWKTLQRKDVIAPECLLRSMHEPTAFFRNRTPFNPCNFLGSSSFFHCADDGNKILTRVWARTWAQGVYLCLLGSPYPRGAIIH